jgi:hypothetical protein
MWKEALRSCFASLSNINLAPIVTSAIEKPAIPVTLSIRETDELRD